ncbi:hypothetical protein IH979_00145 [Patescibacteria group bacterium]|nr:hypothetical protein [Patescibacteria group bacterium]
MKRESWQQQPPGFIFWAMVTLVMAGGLIAIAYQDSTSRVIPEFPSHLCDDVSDIVKNRPGTATAICIRVNKRSLRTHLAYVARHGNWVIENEPALVIEYSSNEENFVSYSTSP